MLEVLKHQLSVVNELIELGLAETEAFKINDVARIMSIVDQQKDAVNRMWMLEQHKVTILLSMGTELPIKKLCQGLSFENRGGIGQEVENMVSCLIKRAKRLQQINETNRLLARMSLSFARMMQKALGVTASGSYDGRGMPAALPGFSRRLDASA